MKKLLQQWRTNIIKYLTPEPEIKEEYIDKMVFLLRRDFTHKEQNDILFAVCDKITQERKKDIIKAEQEFAILQEQTNILEVKMIVS